MQSCVLMVAGRLTADNSAALVAYREVAAKSGPDMSAALKVWTWDTDEYEPSCKISLSYKPLFTKSTRNNWEPKCQGDACEELGKAAFSLAEAAEKDSPALRRQSLKTLTPSQRTQYLAAEGIVSARDRDEEPNEALYIPYVINARIYVVSLGQQSVGWRRFADWRVQFNTVEGGKIVQ